MSSRARPDSCVKQKDKSAEARGVDEHNLNKPRQRTPPNTHKWNVISFVVLWDTHPHMCTHTCTHAHAYTHAHTHAHLTWAWSTSWNVNVSAHSGSLPVGATDVRNVSCSLQRKESDADDVTHAHTHARTHTLGGGVIARVSHCRTMTVWNCLHLFYLTTSA